MKFNIFILFILSLLVAPVFVFADCSKSGTTVIFVNGVFESKDAATTDKGKLEYFYKRFGRGADVDFDLGYNESHVGGASDVIETAIQMYEGGYLDHDLADILRQVHGDLKTQKIILVGHSQGTFYTNAAYDYLIGHGVDKSSISVYNIGTPADFVAGGGKYLTSSTDEVINTIVRALATSVAAKKPLPANIDIKIPNNPGVDYEAGHSFSQVYLGLAPDRLIGDIDQGLNGLVASGNKAECFIQPEPDATYRVFDDGYQVVDNMGDFSKYAGTAIYVPPQWVNLGNAIFQKIYDFGKAAISNIAKDFGQGSASLTSSFNQVNSPKNSHTIVSIPAASTVAPDEAQNQPTENQSLVGPAKTENTQKQLDDIQEKLDIISQEVQALIAQQNPEVQQAEAQIAKQVNNQNQNDNQNTTTNNNTTTGTNATQGSAGGSGGGGGSTTVTYPKILISEVQINPLGQRFVELYNPNSSDVSLAGWYLQRKDSNDISEQSFISSTNFNGKIIPANGYFVISKDILGLDITLSDDNSLALKNPNGDISDKLGFGSAMDPESMATVDPADSQSIGRKVLVDGIEQDTDNNSVDFELDTPTPGAQNAEYVTSIDPTPVTPTLKNILISEVQVAGRTSVNDEFVELYNPNNADIDLSGYSLEKETTSGTKSDLVSSANFYGTIPALGYFLIGPQKNADGTENYKGSATLNLRYSGAGYYVASNNTVLLYNNAVSPILLDKVGLGSAQDFEMTSVQNPSDGLSVGRKVLASGTEQDADNNSVDFELDTPTPGAQNAEYVAPVTPNPDPENPTDPVNPVDPTNPAVPKNIIINEIQIQGVDVYEDFIELYNPNSTDVNLNGYRLVKRAESSAADTTIKSWANDSVSKIPAKQYYLWASSTDNGYPNLINADVSTRQNISSNNGIALRYGAENSGQIIDAVGWGDFDNVLFETIATANPADGKSLQRKWDSAADNPQDTNNNSADFGLGVPTPKSSNIIQAIAQVDKTVLESAINNAITLLAAHPVNDDIGGVSKLAHDAYSNAISAAEAVDNDNNADQAAVTTAISNLASATSVFNSAISTASKADKDAAKAVSDQISTLPHAPVDLSPVVSDDGKITDYLLPFFGYTDIPGECDTTYVCANWIYDGGNNGRSRGLNIISPYPYTLYALIGSFSAGMHELMGNWAQSLQIYINAPYKNYYKCVSPASCPEFMSHVMYVLSFKHEGNDRNTGYSSTPLAFVSPLAFEDNQKIANASAAYNALTEVQRDLVTDYYILQDDVYQMSALNNAANAVLAAETNKTQENLNAANELMEKVEDGPTKAGLQSRINAVQVSIGIAQSQSMSQPAESIDQEASSSSQ